MKKIIATIFVSFACSATVLAGGLVTNTNRTAGFLRNPARGASFGPEAVYFNPAGVAFLENGWHLDFSYQVTYQTRNTTSTYGPLGQNVAHYGQSTNDYTGYTFAPCVPSIHAAWKKDRWSVMASFAIGGGGGSVNYDKGLSSFESNFSVLPNALTAAGLPTTMYGVDAMSLNATSFTGNFTIGGSFLILPCLSVSLQANMNYAIASYEGDLKGISINPIHPILNPTGEMINAETFFRMAGMEEYAAMVADKHLDAKQNGFSISPIIGLCFNKKGWTASARYEFMSSMYMTNDTKEDIVIEGQGMFPDGQKESSDIPAQLTLAGGYDFGKVRVAAEWHHFLDKSASNDNSNLVLGNSNEYIAGVEWDVSKIVTLSTGVQRTVFNLDLDKYQDSNFYLSSTSIGLGGCFQVCKILKLEFGCLFSLYDSRTRTESAYHGNKLNIPGSDTFKRSHVTCGIGAIFKF